MWCVAILLILAVAHYIIRWYIFNVLQSEFADDELRKFKRLFNILKLSFYALWAGLVLIIIFYKFKLGG
jgi:uncharacterized membrane protein